MSTKIRDKFIEHMEFTGLAKQTQRSYITGVKGLAYITTTNLPRR